MLCKACDYKPIRFYLRAIFRGYMPAYAVTDHNEYKKVIS